MISTENRVSINCEQGRHHVCDGLYPWGMHGQFAVCRCTCGHPETAERAKRVAHPCQTECDRTGRPDIFFQGQRWRVLEDGSTGTLHGVRFAPRMAKGYETLTLLVDGAETTKTFLRKELEEVIGA